MFGLGRYVGVLHACSADSFDIIPSTAELQVDFVKHFSHNSGWQPRSCREKVRFSLPLDLLLSCPAFPFQNWILQPEFKTHFPVIMQWEPSSCGIAQAARCENGTDFGEVRLACLPLTTVTLIKSLPSFTFCATPDNPRKPNRNAASAKPSEKLSRGRGRNPLRDPARVRR